MRDRTDVLRSVKKYVNLALTPATGEDGELRRWEVRLSYEEGAFRRPFARVGTAGQEVQSGPFHDIESVQPMSIVLHPVERSRPEEALLEAERCRRELMRAIRIGAGELAAPVGLTVAEDDGSLPAGAYSWAVTAMTRRAESAPQRIDTSLPSDGGALLEWERVPDAVAYRVYRGAVEGSEQLVAAVTTTEYLDAGGTALGALVRAGARGTLGQPLRIPLWDWDGIPLEPAPDQPPEVATSRERSEHDFISVRDVNIDVVADPQDDLLLAVVCSLRVAWKQPGQAAQDGADLTDIRVRIVH